MRVMGLGRNCARRESEANAGWGGRIRTFDLLIQSQAPYRLATPQRAPQSLPEALFQTPNVAIPVVGCCCISRPICIHLRASADGTGTTAKHESVARRHYAKLRRGAGVIGTAALDAPLEGARSRKGRRLSATVPL